MAAPKFRYLIITEDDEVLGTDSEEKMKDYIEDLCTVIDVEKGKLLYYPLGEEEEIEEAPEFDNGMNEIDGLDSDA